MSFLLLWLLHAVLPSVPQLPPACPDRMVKVSAKTCIDVFPFPNDDDGEVWFGLSAVEETYLDLPISWDAETLCAEVGKRVCTWDEWRAACRGTPRKECPAVTQYIEPDWFKVMNRDVEEMLRLDQHENWREYLDCVSSVGARMMLGNGEEWVRVGNGHAFTRGFWAREGGCNTLNTSHAGSWHDYATTTRCCLDL